jgi:hypothetical protein
LGGFPGFAGAWTRWRLFLRPIPGRSLKCYSSKPLRLGASALYIAL